MQSSSCVYTPGTGSSLPYVALYADNLLFFGPSLAEAQKVKAELATLYELINLGAAESVLGVQVVRGKNASVSLSQQAHLEDVLACFNMTN